MGQPDALLQSDDINYYDNEYDLGLFDQPDVVVGDD